MATCLRGRNLGDDGMNIRRPGLMRKSARLTSANARYVAGAKPAEALKTQRAAKASKTVLRLRCRPQPSADQGAARGRPGKGSDEGAKVRYPKNFAHRGEGESAGILKVAGNPKQIEIPGRVCAPPRRQHAPVLPRLEDFAQRQLLFRGSAGRRFACFHRRGVGCTLRAPDLPDAPKARAEAATSPTSRSGRNVARHP